MPPMNVPTYATNLLAVSKIATFVSSFVDGGLLFELKLREARAPLDKFADVVTGGETITK